jgi:hypothetical protein
VLELPVVTETAQRLGIEHTAHYLFGVRRGIVSEAENEFTGDIRGVLLTAGWGRAAGKEAVACQQQKSNQMRQSKPLYH